MCLLAETLALSSPVRSERLCPGPGEFGTGSALASPPEFLEQFGLSVDYAKILTFFQRGASTSISCVEQKRNM